MKGDEDLTDEIAAEFLDDIPGEFALLAAALESVDPTLAARCAHTIKGASAAKRFAASLSSRRLREEMVKRSER